MSELDFLDRGSAPAPPTRAPALSPERLGKITASMAAVVMGADKLTLEKYVKALAWERVYGVRDEGFQSRMMDRGQRLEPQALSWYSESVGVGLDPNPGFKVHKGLACVGASPDGIAVRGREKWTVQAKCPGSDAWMDFLLDRKPGPYAWQCRWEAWVCGYRSTALVIWHPVAGGIVIPVFLEKSHVYEMAERAIMTDTRVNQWVEILQKGTDQ